MRSGAPGKASDPLPSAPTRRGGRGTALLLAAVVGSGIMAERLCGGNVGLALPKASRHLAYLRRAGLVVVRKDGLWKHYSLAPARTPCHRTLIACLSGCFREVPELGANSKRYDRLRKRGGCCPT